MTPTSRVALAAISAVTLLALAGCGGSKAAANPQPAGSTAPATFVVTGHISISTGDMDTAGSVCFGGAGYEDITNGAQAVVYDASGKSLAIGQLSAGLTDGQGSCVWPITVANVPGGVGPYSIQVTHRGKTAFNETDAQHVSLQLGS